MQTFTLKFETGDGLERFIEIQAHSVDAALAKWDKLRQPGEFLVSVGHPCRIHWPEN